MGKEKRKAKAELEKKSKNKSYTAPIILAILAAGTVLLSRSVTSILSAICFIAAGVIILKKESR